jgi:hypothetical protein
VSSLVTVILTVIATVIVIIVAFVYFQHRMIKINQNPDPSLYELMRYIPNYLGTMVFGGC